MGNFCHYLDQHQVGKSFSSPVHLFLVQPTPCTCHYQFSPVAQLCPTLCNPVNCSTPGLPVHYQLLESIQNPCPLSRWCHPAISSSVVPFSSCPQSFPASGAFQMSQLFTSGGQSIGVSASTSVLPMNTQDRSPLGCHYPSPLFEHLSSGYYTTLPTSHLSLTTSLLNKCHYPHFIVRNQRFWEVE